MIPVIILVGVVFVLVRWFLARRHRQGAQLGANVAAMQPLTEWSARHVKLPSGKRRRVSARRFR
jgi:predicted ABC-type sugar transport system permease subunit